MLDDCRRRRLERSHQDWQNRLPALCAAEAIASIGPANALLENLCTHRDTHERHRELAMTPLAAWQLAKKDGRSALRPPPKRPWWPDVFSQRSTVKVQPDGRAAAGTARLRSQAPPGTRLVHCLHPNGDISILAIPQFTPSNRKSSSTFPPPEKTLRLGSQASVRLCSPSHTPRVLASVSVVEPLGGCKSGVRRDCKRRAPLCRFHRSRDLSGQIARNETAHRTPLRAFA